MHTFYSLSQYKICLQCGRPGSIPESRRSPGEKNGYLCQYSCLENSMDRGTWWIPWGCKELDTTEWLTLALYSTYWYILDISVAIKISIFLTFCFLCCQCIKIKFSSKMILKFRDLFIKFPICNSLSHWYCQCN